MVSNNHGTTCSMLSTSNAQGTRRNLRKLLEKVIVTKLIIFLILLESITADKYEESDADQQSKCSKWQQLEPAIPTVLFC